MGISRMIRMVKVEKSSERFLDAEMTRMLRFGLRSRHQTTKAEVTQDFPTPRKASITERFGPCCRKSARSYWTGVGSLPSRNCFQTR
jgi:hypothetical protein